MTTIEKFNDNVMHTYGRYDLVMGSGSGREATDENNKKYIDFGSGIGTNSLGYCDEEWADAVCKQVRSIQHTSNYYYTAVQAEFAEKLCKVTGYDKVFFGNSGAEANECAIKIARKYSFDKYGKGRHTIITLVNSFHGRTMATLSATGQDVFHNYFFPFLEGFVHTPANDIEALKKCADDTVCAIMIEMVQGEGGVVKLDEDFVKAVRAICDEKDILMIADEVQTGAGRTGKFLASEHFGVKPDITTMAKGIAGGIPVGACLASEKCSSVLTPGTHGSTFGGNPLACAGGNVVVSRVSSPEFLAEVQKKSEYIFDKVSKMKGVASVTGLGLMIGIELTEKKAADVVKAALDKGLLLLTAKTKVRLLPPLNITFEEIDAGLKILEEILAE
ncbi:aspartate aminotransferase family protein [Ruminococcus sp. HUN007]|uniref:aspartate aminotransferase family protein n=1 Tax=Ruminococcus sp. HUN007 TaxID=1514668 RepID=UPI0005D1BBAA|nr:aspartate aminotransferase family protein [Ruminococcus sp. HUN007]